MRKLKLLTLSAVFLASSLGLAFDGKAQVLKPQPEIQTTFEGLDLKGHDFNNKNLLVYFGTAYSTPSCESFFAEADLTVRLSKCADMQLIFICPYAEGEVNNLSIRQAERSGFIVLQGDLTTVKNLAAKYKSRYFGSDAYGNPENHTNLVFIQGANGSNKLIFTGKTFPGESAPAIREALGCGR